MAGSSVSVVVYHQNIDAMNMPRGMVYRYVHDKGRRAAVVAKSLVPVDTGRLRGSIRVEAPRFTRNSVSVRVSARAKHAIWVHEGTGPIIFVDLTQNGFFWKPKSKGSTFRMRYFADIRGQDANPFLEHALAVSMKDPFSSRGTWFRDNPFG